MLQNTIVRNKIDPDGDIKYFTDFMNSNKPLFFNRLGGIEYYVAGEYFENDKLIDDGNWVETRLKLLQNYPGYFDFTNDIEHLRDYLNKTVQYFKNSDDFTYVDSFMDNAFRTNTFCHRDEIFLNEIANGKTVIDYKFFSGIRPFMKSYCDWGKNKKILIVSPLSKSIQHQFKNKDKLYIDYQFPDFELLTYNTKITYNTIGDTKETLNITTNNWNEECQRISEDIKQIDFDIAFLSCGVYAMFLGDFIKNVMQKKSIITGGILNVFFNIYGDRWDEEFYRTRGLNLDYQIDPFENDDIINIRGGRNNGPGESLNAYFGRRKK